MYDQISSNIWKSYALVFLFFLLVIGLGYLFAVAWGFPELVALAVIFAIIMSIGGYYHSDKIVLRMSQARPATKQEHAHLVNSVEGLAIAAGLPAPKIYVIDDPAPNAFATGRNPENGVIAITTGLMEKLNRVELEGVIAHEMAHIKGYDIRLMTLVAVLAGTVVLISDWILRSMWYGRRVTRVRRAEGSPLILVLVILAAILAPIVAMIIKMAISRKREFLSDVQGAMLTRYPEGLASALDKIASDHQPLEVANKATAHMYIVNPLKDVRGSLNSLFATHPPIEERIRRLRAM